MATEIERKFLVKTSLDFLRGSKKETIVQGYLHQQGMTSRVRVVDAQKAYITLKGPKKGFSCAEYEYEIPLEDAKELLVLCGKRIVEKTRYHVVHAQHVWHVDVYEGKLKGLVTAEVELESTKEAIETPVWTSIELTHKKGFSNKKLATSRRYPKKYKCQ